MATLTATELAADFKTTPKTVRSFLRDDARSRELPIPGKGARWAIEAREVRSLRTRFAKWTIEQDEARKAREAAREAKVENNDQADATNA